MTTSLCSLPGLWHGHHIKRSLARAVALGCLAITAECVFAQNWTTTTAPIANWVSVVSSADGNKLAALIQCG